MTENITTAASGAASQPEALLQAALKTLDWYAAGNHEVTLSGRIDWAAERARLEAAGYSPRGESYNGEEHFCETGGKAEETAAMIRAALAAPAGAYAPLPKPYSAAAALGLDDLYTSDDMRAYADAHRTSSAPAAGEEGQLTPGWLQMLQDKNQGNQAK